MKKIRKILISILFVFSTLILLQTLFYTLPTASIVEASSIKISKSKYSMQAGSTYKLKITGTKKKIKWTSNNKKIATVNSNGKVTAIKKGTVTITAKIGKTSYRCKVTVTKSNSNTIYITNSGKKYHRASCSCLRKSKIKTTLNNAKLNGYTPCGKCNP